MSSRLASDTAFYAAAMLAERAFGLLLLPVLTRRLSPAEYGIWTQTYVVSSMLMPIVVFCLPAAMVRYFSAGVDFARRRRWTARALGWMALGLGIAALAATSVPGWIAAWVYGQAGASPFVLVLAALLAADSLGDMAIGFLRSAFRVRWVAALVLARGALRFGFMSMALVILAWDFRLAFLVAVCLQAALVAGFMIVAFARADSPSAATTSTPTVEWKAMLAFSAPLVLISVLTSVNAFTDRFVLTHLMGLDTVAVYAAASSLVSLASIAYTVLGFTLFPVLSKRWAEGDESGATDLSDRAVRVFLFLALPFVVCLAAIVGPLLPLLATGNYRVGSDVVLMLGLGMVGYGLYQIMLYLMLLSGHGMRAAWLVVAAAAVNAAINLALVPRFGMSAAAGAAFASNGVLAVGAYASARMRFPWRSALHTAAIGVVAAAGAFVAARHVGGPGWTGIGAAVGLAATIVVVADLLSRPSMIRALLDSRRAAA